MKLGLILLSVGSLLVACGQPNLGKSGRAPQFNESSVGNGGNDLTFSVDASIRRCFLEERPEFQEAVPQPAREKLADWLSEESFRIKVTNSRVGTSPVYASTYQGAAVLVVDSSFAETFVSMPSLVREGDLNQVWQAILFYAVAEKVLPLNTVRGFLEGVSGSEVSMLAAAGFGDWIPLPTKKANLDSLVRKAAQKGLAPLVHDTGLSESEEMALRDYISGGNFPIVPVHFTLADKEGHPLHGRVAADGSIEINVYRWSGYFDSREELLPEKKGIVLHEIVRSAFFRGIISVNDDFNVISSRILKNAYFQ